MAGLGTQYMLGNVLVLYFCLLGLEASGCLLRLHAVDLFSCLFLCNVFIVFQTTATTTTPPVTIVCSGTSSLIMTFTMGPTLIKLPATSGQHNAVLLPLLMPRDMRCCWPYHCDTAVTSVPDASLDICQLCHRSLACKFLF